MNHFTYITALSMLFCVSSFAQSKKLLRTYGILKMTETTIKVEKGEEQAAYVSEYERYDSDGEWIEKTDLLADGKIKVQELRRYEKGEVVEETKDEPLEREVVESFPKFSRKLSKFEKGKLTELTYYDRTGEIEKIKRFRYNKFDDIFEEITESSTGKLLEKEIYSYDERGLKSEKKILDESGEVIEIKRYTYE